jgi:hypothetical protein
MIGDSSAAGASEAGLGAATTVQEV